MVISGYEHNAVTRTLADIGGVSCRIVNARLFDPDRVAAPSVGQPHGGPEEPGSDARPFKGTAHALGMGQGGPDLLHRLAGGGNRSSRYCQEEAR